MDAVAKAKEKVVPQELQEFEETTNFFGNLTMLVVDQERSIITLSDRVSASIPKGKA